MTDTEQAMRDRLETLEHIAAKMAIAMQYHLRHANAPREDCQTCISALDEYLVFTYPQRLATPG